ncbi:MAG: sulfotransferase [Leptolyngbya sp. SIO1D8]|nr:sulfotransferase [Leptolyngbya sp. SIO1D8]
MGHPQTPNPRLLHPLMGGNLRMLLAVLSRNGTGRYPLHLALILTVALLRWPFSTYERWRVIQAPLPPEDQAPPVFIVGHWRSGTTFLYNVLSRAPQFAYVSPLATGLPWDFLTLGTLLRPILERALPEERFIDQVSVNPDSPQEDEIALASMQPISFYHGLYFPKHFVKNFNAGIFFEHCSQEDIEHWEWAMVHFCKKLQLQNPGQQLLIKNPVYTARVQQLRNLWPHAKFIHIYRNPYVVFQSTLNFYAKLFQELALQPFNQDLIPDIVLESYPKMMERLFRDTAKLPAQDFVELQFEAFEADPLGHLHRIYTQLELQGWEQAQPHFQQYLQAQRQYRKNRYAFPQDAIAQVQNHWQPFIDRWGYQPPQVEKSIPPAGDR